MSLPKLTAQNIWKAFIPKKGQPVMALQDVSLTILENEFVSIIGPSGCGKSTLLMMAAGLDEPTQGELRVDGQPVVGPGAERGMVFQGYTLFPWLSVSENIRFALKKSRLPLAEQRDLVQRYIHLVGLDGFENALPNTLSGGMRQRAAIARALVYQPKMLLMDEPFGALDSQTRLLMQELLLQVWEVNRTTVMFVTHDIEEALLLSDRVYVMTARPGRIKAEVQVELPRPRSLIETEAMPRFRELRQYLFAMIREEAPTNVCVALNDGNA